MKCLMPGVLAGLAAMLTAGSGYAGQLQTPDVRTTIDDSTSTIDYPWGVVVDAGGVVYVADKGLDTVRMYAPSAGGYTSAGLLADGATFLEPVGLAFDGAGAIYVGDDQDVTKFIRQAGGSYAPSASIGQGVLSGVYGVAVDGVGDVFVADTGNTAVREFIPSGGGYAQAPDITAGRYDYDVAADAAGNVYVADTFAHQVQIFHPSASGYPLTPDVTLDMLVGTAYGVALDRYGNVYVADAAGKRIVRFTADGQGGFAAPVTIANGFTLAPHRVTVDPMVNLYVTVADAYVGALVKIGDRVFGDGFE